MSHVKCNRRARCRALMGTVAQASFNSQPHPLTVIFCLLYYLRIKSKSAPRKKMFLFPHVPAKLLIYISSNSIGNFIQKQNTLMDTNSRNWKWARKNHLLAVVSLFLLQNHLHVSVMFVEAKTSVSVHVQLQVLAPPFFSSLL